MKILRKIMKFQLFIIFETLWTKKKKRERKILALQKLFILSQTSISAVVFIGFFFEIPPSKHSILLDFVTHSDSGRWFTALLYSFIFFWCIFLVAGFTESVEPWQPVRACEEFWHFFQAHLGASRYTRGRRNRLGIDRGTSKLVRTFNRSMIALLEKS